MIYILSLAAADRIRGGGWFRYSHLAGMLLMGICVSVILNLHGWGFGYGVLAVMVGASWGWGNPLGAAFDGRPMGTACEWWQVGILRKSTLAALLARGAMWGLPLAPLVPLAPVAFAIPFALSPYLARVIPWNGDRWAVLEFSRGAMTGSLLYLGGLNMGVVKMEQLKHAIDAISIGAVVSTILGLLPAMAAFLSIIWTLIRIYETRTVQGWLGK